MTYLDSLKSVELQLDFSQVRVLLIASEQLLNGMPKTLSNYPKRAWKKMKVEVRVKSRLIKVTPGESPKKRLYSD